MDAALKAVNSKSDAIRSQSNAAIHSFNLVKRLLKKSSAQHLNGSSDGTVQTDGADSTAVDRGSLARVGESGGQIQEMIAPRGLSQGGREVSLNDSGSASIQANGYQQNKLGEKWEDGAIREPVMLNPRPVNDPQNPVVVSGFLC